MIQPFLDKIDLYTGINNNTDISNNNNTDISNNLLLDPKYKFIKFITSFFISSTVILLIVLFNSNIIFLINSASTNKEVLDLLFPSDCITTPYGPLYVIGNDGKQELDENDKSIIRPICEKMDKNPTNKTNNSGPDWPYTKFNSNDAINPVQDYINYILRSVASTDTTANSLIKKTLEFSSKVSNRFIIVLLGLIILLLIGTFIIPAIIYGFNIIKNEASLLFSDKTFLITKGLVFWTFPTILYLFNPSFTLYKTICLFFRLTFYPLISGHAKDILKIMIENKDIIGFILGYSYIVCAKNLLSNTMSNILHYLYFTALVVYILIYIIRYI